MSRKQDLSFGKTKRDTWDATDVPVRWSPDALATDPLVARFPVGLKVIIYDVVKVHRDYWYLVRPESLKNMTAGWVHRNNIHITEQNSFLRFRLEGLNRQYVEKAPS